MDIPRYALVPVTLLAILQKLHRRSGYWLVHYSTSGRTTADTGDVLTSAGGRWSELASKLPVKHCVLFDQVVSSEESIPTEYM